MRSKSLKILWVLFLVFLIWGSQISSFQDTLSALIVPVIILSLLIIGSDFLGENFVKGGRPHTKTPGVVVRIFALIVGTTWMLFYVLNI